MDFHNDNLTFKLVIKVFFYSSTDAQVNCLKNNFKINHTPMYLNWLF